MGMLGKLTCTCITKNLTRYRKKSDCVKARYTQQDEQYDCKRGMFWAALFQDAHTLEDCWTV